MSGEGNEQQQTPGAGAGPGRTEEERDDKFFGLCDRIERAWSLRRDPDIVHQLAAENPDMAEDLYEFFADLIDSEDRYEAPPEALEYTERRIKQWLDSDGHAMMERMARESGGSTSTASPPTPTVGSGDKLEALKELGLGYLGYLQECTGLEPDELFRVLEVPKEVYIFVQKDPDGTPGPVKDELAQRAARRSKADRETARKCLDLKLPKAAHRRTPYSAKPKRFSQAIRASKMSEKEKQYWLSLAGEE